MLQVSTITELRKILKSERQSGKKIGFVPTMGYLHEGHLTLMREAKARADIAVVSIFVNPTQFGPNEDLDKYPRDLERDKDLAASVNVDILFVPAVDEMYPAGHCTYVDVSSNLTQVLCGKSRPGHFKGVATVVNKLLNIVQPNIALFGQKDWQQLAVIKRMVRDLNMDVKIVGIPTVREKDGLAMSSRNTYLTPEERQAALTISKSLRLAQEMLDNGEKDVDNILSTLQKVIGSEKLNEIEYLVICDPETLASINSIDRDSLVAVAVKVRGTRLIDNALIRPKA